MQLTNYRMRSRSRMMKWPFLFSILCLVSFQCSQPESDSGTFFRACNSGCGLYEIDGKGTGQLGDVKWKFKTNGKIFSSPAVASGVVYIGSGDHNLYAIDKETGNVIWAFKTGGAIHSSPAVAGNTIFFGSFDGYYYAVDSRSGALKWKVKTEGERWMGGVGYFGMKPLDEYTEDAWDYFLSSPTFRKEGESLAVYFGSSDGNVYAIDARDGSILWKFQTSGSIHTTPAIDDSTVYVGSWDALLYAINIKTGKLKWTFKTGDAPGFTGIQSSPVVNNGKLYFGARDAKLYCLDASSGERIWSYDAENSWILSSPTIKDSTLYVGTSDSYLLLAIDANTGKERFRFKANGYIYSSPAIAGNTAYFGDFTGKLFAVDLSSSGQKWSEVITEGRRVHAANVLKEDRLDFVFASQGKDLSLRSTTTEVMDRFYSLGSIVSSGAVDGRVLFVGSSDGFLYAVNIR